jgi:hypothetical protein
MIMTSVRSAHINEEKHSTTLILRALSDDKSLDLFEIIASASARDTIYSTDNGELINTQQLLSKVKLTRKQYYSRISTLISSGLIKRSNGKYLLTSLGKVAYCAKALIDQAINDHWKLKAIDAIETKSSPGILAEEREKIVDMLIDNNELKGILTTGSYLLNEAKNQSYAVDVKSNSSVFRSPTTMRINQMFEKEPKAFLSSNRVTEQTLY